MMKIAVFSTKPYDREFLSSANASRHELHFFEPHLSEQTAGLAAGFEAVCVFVNDQVNAAVIATLDSLGVRLIALRCAGYNNVDLSAATKHGITVVRVPAYSPYAVAEHTIALMLALNRNCIAPIIGSEKGISLSMAWSGSTCTEKQSA